MKKINVIYNEEEDKKPPPNCAHGPTLLFEKYSIGSETVARRFYACSACRDRKDCDFFCWADEYENKLKIGENNSINLALNQSNTKKDFDWPSRLFKIQSYEESEIKFCRTCDLLLLKTEWTDHGSEHSVIESVNLLQPSNFFSKLESNKKEAQYTFKDSSVKFFKEMVKKLGYTHVLCIGTPTLHQEFLQNSDVDSLLLDIDNRFKQFDASSKFCHYNMFNHHFFVEANGRERYKNFLKSAHSSNNNSKTKLLIMIDPPFGGLLQILAHTVQAITEDTKQICKTTEDSSFLPTMLFFPYFHEKMVHEYFKTFKMSDYQVEYGNHKRFQNSSQGRKHGSPIRIFTNISLSSIELPISDGYKYCDVCEIYVVESNQHCFKCQACTSKDGRPYTHCVKCERCVKSSWKHCKTCKMCVIIGHDCNDTKMIKGCYKCGDMSHKLSECPIKAAMKLRPNLKRKFNCKKGKKVKKPRK